MKKFTFIILLVFASFGNSLAEEVNLDNIPNGKIKDSIIAKNITSDDCIQSFTNKTILVDLEELSQEEKQAVLKSIEDEKLKTKLWEQTALVFLIAVLIPFIGMLLEDLGIIKCAQDGCFPY